MSYLIKDKNGVEIQDAHGKEIYETYVLSDCNNLGKIYRDVDATGVQQCPQFSSLYSTIEYNDGRVFGHCCECIDGADRQFVEGSGFICVNSVDEL